MFSNSKGSFSTSKILNKNNNEIYEYTTITENNNMTRTCHILGLLQDRVK